MRCCGGSAGLCTRKGGTSSSNDWLRWKLAMPAVATDVVLVPQPTMRYGGTTSSLDVVGARPGCRRLPRAPERSQDSQRQVAGGHHSVAGRG